MLARHRVIAVVKDYDAVKTSVDHLKTIWPGGTWPEGLTFEQNLIDLGWHQKEFQMRQSFAYTVVNPSKSQVTGCVYINPTRKAGYDAVVYLWARQSELAGGLEDRLQGLPFEYVLTIPDQTEATLAMSPRGKVPFIGTEHGFINEASVILEYLEERGEGKALLPTDPCQRAPASSPRCRPGSTGLRNRAGNRVGGCRHDEDPRYLR